MDARRASSSLSENGFFKKPAVPNSRAMEATSGLADLQGVRHVLTPAKQSARLSLVHQRAQKPTRQVLQLESAHVAFLRVATICLKGTEQAVALLW